MSLTLSDYPQGGAVGALGLAHKFQARFEVSDNHKNSFSKNYKLRS
jgi:hypothetical protein